MPGKPLRPCNRPGCPSLTTERYCEQHKHIEEQRRGSSAQRGYGYRWQKYRLEYLRRHPLCVRCQAAGRVEAATVVDHIIPHKGDRVRMWAMDNHQALCKPCHDHKTATEDGAFGR